MIERYLIHYFLAVVDNGNFSRAAQRCGVSQPTLSVGIAKLEAQIDHVLFNRANRRVELTGAGSKFASYARRIEAEFARAEQAMAENDRSKLVRLGVISSLPSGWIENATREACRVDGETLEIVEGRMRELLPRLERGRIDGIIVVLGSDARGREPLFEEGYALALPDTHSLAHRKILEPEEVADAQMIVRRHCEALPAVSRFFTQRGIRPYFAARTVSDDRAIAFVRAGLGITVMPRCFAQPGVVMPLLSGFEQRRVIGILTDTATRKRFEDSRGINRFCSTLRTDAAMAAA